MFLIKLNVKNVYIIYFFTISMISMVFAWQLFQSCTQLLIYHNMFLNIQAERVPFTLYNHVDVFITDSCRVSEVINKVSYIYNI